MVRSNARQQVKRNPAAHSANRNPHHPPRPDSQPADSEHLNTRTPEHRPSAIWDITDQLQENFNRVKAILDSITDDDGPRAKLEAAAEIRQHIALAHKTLEAASRVEAVRHFETAVLNILEESGASIRRRVINKLNHRLKRLDQQARHAETESADSAIPSP